MNSINNKRGNLYLLGILIVVFLTSNHHILWSNDLTSLSFYMTIVGIAMIRPIQYLVMQRGVMARTEIDFGFLLLWISFSAMLLLSEINHSTLLESMFFVVIFPVVYLFGVNKLDGDRTQLHLANIISMIPFALIALFMVFKGHKFSTNGIALIILSGTISLISLDARVLKTKNLPRYILYMMGVLLLGYAMTGIHSRTSMLAFVTCLLLTIIMDIVYIVKSKDPAYRPFLWFYRLLILGLVIALFINRDKFDFLTSKWGSDISSSRFEIWSETLKNITLFGKGYDFYLVQRLKGPHNLFFGLIGFTGILSFLLFVVIIVKFIIDYFKRTTTADFLGRDRDIFIFFIGYMISGSLEGFLQYPFYRNANIVFLAVIGSFYLQKREAKEPPLPTSAPSFGLLRLHFLLVIIACLLTVTLVQGDGNIVTRFLS